MKYPRPGQQQRRVYKGMTSLDPRDVKARIAELRPNKYRWGRNEMMTRWTLLVLVSAIVVVMLAFMVGR